MIDSTLMTAILNSLVDPLLFCDTDHIIRFMNSAARTHYGPRETLLGSSVLDCHNKESRQLMREILTTMEQGEEERLITDNSKHRIYMRAVRDLEGRLLGYYERFEPPA